MQLGFNAKDAKTQRRKGKKRFSLAQGLSPFGDLALQAKSALRPCDFATLR
jgi:hypothetical protein